MAAVWLLHFALRRSEAGVPNTSRQCRKDQRAAAANGQQAGFKPLSYLPHVRPRLYQYASQAIPTLSLLYSLTPFFPPFVSVLKI